MLGQHHAVHQLTSTSYVDRWFSNFVGNRTNLLVVDFIRPDGRADGHEVHPYSSTGLLGMDFALTGERMDI